jgi:hypothetical protein
MSDTAHDAPTAVVSSSPLEGLEYATEGGWPAPFWDLIRWLRANGCSEYAYRLEQLADYAYRLEWESPSSPRLAATLNDMRNALAPLINNPPSHLRPELHKELKRLRHAAARFVQYRLRQLAGSREGYERAVRGLAARLAAPSAAAPEFVPTAEDITILTVLAKAPGALLNKVIVQKAATMLREQRRARQETRLILVSETTLGDRIPVLLGAGLVARPLTKKGKERMRKGVGITSKGRDLLQRAPG